MKINDRYFLNPAHLGLARERYFLKDDNGAPVEDDIGDVFERVVDFIYQDDKDHKEEALQLRNEKKIIDAGRPLAQAGTKVTNFFNCFVLGFDDDTRESISDLKRKHFNIQALGGGTGMNFSTLRPNGSICKTTQSRSSGAVGFITDISYQSSNVCQPGNRSGANMGLLEDWHPDLYEFITKKSESNWENIRKFSTVYSEDEFSYFQWKHPHPWQMFNVSVGSSDKLMDAVIDNPDKEWVLSWKGQPWHLWKFKNTVGPSSNSKYEKEFTVVASSEDMAWYKASSNVPYFNKENLELLEGPYSLTAMQWFEMICKNAWEDGCPGILFMDQAKKFHNGEYFNPISACNPCVPSYTWVMTSDGPRQVSDLIGKPFEALVDGKTYKCRTGFVKTGYREIITIKLKNGMSLDLTGNHKVLVLDDFGNREWLEAADIGAGDRVVLNDHSDSSIVGWEGCGSFNEGYLLGSLVGDGHITGGKAVLSTWDSDTGVDGTRKQILSSCDILKKRSDFSGWVDVKGTDRKVLSLKSIENLAEKFGIDEHKKISERIENASSTFYCGFLRGFFDADGSVQGTQKKGVSIRLWQTNKERLEVVQRMLARLGIISKIYYDRKPKRVETIRGEDYNCAPGHELVISNESVIVFKERIGFSNTNKSSVLDNLVSSYKRAPNKEKFYSAVFDVKKSGYADVYDATVDEIHAFDANGFYVHNCAEEMLPKNGVCDLTSLILPSFFDGEDFDWAGFRVAIRQAVRGLDNIISLNVTGESDIDENSLSERRIGLGTTGVAELLILMKLKYSSEEGRGFVGKVLEFLRDEAYDMSIDLAIEKGPFPKFDYNGFSRSAFFKTLPLKIRKRIKEHGIRNVTVLTQAPTGTTGTMVGFATGCEPYFAMCFLRNSRVGSFLDGSPAFLAWLHDNGIDYKEYDYDLEKLKESANVPDYFEEAHKIHWKDHIRMQAVFAKYVDSSVSKTINLPNDATIEDVVEAYTMAYQLGIKSTTVYRDGSKKQILEKIVKSSNNKRPVDIIRAHAPKRPKELECDIYHTKVKGEKWTVLVGLLDDVPYEVFCAPQDNFEIASKYKKGVLVKNGKGSYYLDTGDFKLKNISSYLKTDEHRVITRLLSTCLRHGVPMPFLLDQLSKADGTVVDFSKAINRVLKKYGDASALHNGGHKCEKCGSTNVVLNGGCPSCLDCSYSKCG